MKTILRAADGEPAVWCSWQDLRDKGKGSPNGRAWLHVPHNCFGVEWAFTFGLGLEAEFADSVTGADALSLKFGLLFVTLWLSCERARWVKLLPGVRWEKGSWGKGQRRIGGTFRREDFFGYLWLNPNGDAFDAPKRHPKLINYADLLFGPAKYSQTNSATLATWLAMPEGAYPVTVEIYDAVWTRPRFGRQVRLTRAEIECGAGIPHAGKWEDDDATYGMTCPAATPTAALDQLRASVLADRAKYGGPAWQPRAGWPAHCLRSATP